MKKEKLRRTMNHSMIFYFVSLASEPVFIVLIEEQANCCNKAQVSIHEVINVPLYLTKKALLI